MRILILVDCYLPSPHGAAKLIHDLGVELQRQGHEVTILTVSSDMSGKFEVSSEHGLRVARVRVGPIKGASRVVRAFNEARLSSVVWRRAGVFLAQNRADLIVFHSPTIFFGALIRRLKSLWGCPAYMILRDIFPQWAVDAGILRRGLVWRFFRWKEVEQYEVSDVIGVQTPGDLKYFQRSFPHNKKYQLEVLYNWTALDAPDLTPAHYRADLGLRDKIVFFYGGNLGVAQDLENILRLARSLVNHPEIYFLLVGEGSEAGRLERAIVAEGLLNIQILPSVDQLTYLSMLGEFDVGLISLDRRIAIHNLPSKLLGYMFQSMPTLASVNPGHDLFEILEKNQAGVCLLNGDDERLCAAALRLANDSELRKRMGQNSRKVLERLFSVNAAAAQILTHFQPQAVETMEGAAVEAMGISLSRGRFPAEQ